jgi:hypothetical protein
MKMMEIKLTKDISLWTMNNYKSNVRNDIFSSQLFYNADVIISEWHINIVK